jgi:hypothetical protein
VSSGRICTDRLSADRDIRAPRRKPRRLTDRRERRWRVCSLKMLASAFSCTDAARVRRVSPEIEVEYAVHGSPLTAFVAIVVTPS